MKGKLVQFKDHDKAKWSLTPISAHNWNSQVSWETSDSTLHKDPLLIYCSCGQHDLQTEYRTFGFKAGIKRRVVARNFSREIPRPREMAQGRCRKQIDLGGKWSLMKFRVLQISGLHNVTEIHEVRFNGD